MVGDADGWKLGADDGDDGADDEAASSDPDTSSDEEEEGNAQADHDGAGGATTL